MKRFIPLPRKIGAPILYTEPGRTDFAQRLHGRLVAMIHNMLIGLDGSDYSRSAVELGIRWAKQTGCGLVGLGVVDEPTICRSEPVGMWGSHFKQRRDERLLDDARRQVREFLDQFARRCRESEVRYRTMEEVGLPFERILFRAEDLDITLLGRETHFQFETQTAADQMVKKVLCHSRRPVVIVPKQLPDKGDNGAPTVAVLAYDAGPSSVRALQALQASGIEAGHLSVRVVSVDPQEILARRRADEAVDFLRHHGISASAVPLAGKRPAQAILKEAEQCRADLIVMGAFSHSGVVSLFRGSVTRSVLQASPDRLLFLHH